MKFNPEEIRAAMDSRLSDIQPSKARRERIRNAVREDEKPKRKYSLTAAVATAALAVVVLTGVLLSTGPNLFGIGGNQDARIGQNATQTALPTQWAAASQSTDDPALYDSLTDGCVAYYDGSTLVLDYALQRDTQLEPFLPTEEQLAAMWKIPYDNFSENYPDMQDPQMQPFSVAMENGGPGGVIEYNLMADYRVYTEAGVSLGHADWTGDAFDGDTWTGYRQYAGVALDSEISTLRVPLWRKAQYRYFDGSDVYIMNGVPEAAGSLTANVVRASTPLAPAYAAQNPAYTVQTLASTPDIPVQTVRMTGQGRYNRSTVKTELVVTESVSVLTLAPEGTGFAVPTAAYWAEIMRDSTTITQPDSIGDYWYRVILEDTNGDRVYSQNIVPADKGNITLLLPGMTNLPEMMTVSMLLYNWETATEVLRPITLTAAEEPRPDTIKDTEAYITSVAYNSSSLVVGYTMEGGTQFAPFTPTAAQRAAMAKTDNAKATLLYNDRTHPLVEQYMDAVQSGEAYGLAIYTVAADDPITGGYGIDLGTANTSSGTANNGTTTMESEYTPPQPAPEFLDLSIPLRENVLYLYFDGTDAYWMNLPPQPAGAMTAIAWREDAPAQVMSGTGSYFGAPVVAEAKVSAAYVEVSLQLPDEEFPAPDEAFWYSTMQRFDNPPGEPELNGDCWYELTAVDGEGNHLRLESLEQRDAHTLTAVFYGTGGMPDTLSVELLLASGNAAATLVMPIAMTPDDAPVTVSTWEELNEAALAGASEVIIDRDIYFGDSGSTIVFHNAVTLRAATGEHHTLDGHGKQILCVQGESENAPLSAVTTIRGLTFKNGGFPQTSTKVFQYGEGMAVSVQGPLLAEDCTFQNNMMLISSALAVFGDTTLLDCHFKENWGLNGGGLYTEGADVIINGCTFSNNRAQQGGGIYALRGSLTIIESTFSDNAAEKEGGAVYVLRSELSIMKSTLDGNSAETRGGAISAYNKSIVLHETQFSQNKAAAGGAVYSNNGSVYLDGGELTGNTADQGAGIYAVRSELTLASGMITDNTAAEAGGGLYLEQSAYTVEACEITHNTPEDIAEP